jgi:hypothetical protein
MGWVYKAKAAEKHECSPPWILWRRVGSIWECDLCGKRWWIVSCGEWGKAWNSYPTEGEK